MLFYMKMIKDADFTQFAFTYFFSWNIVRKTDEVIKLFTSSHQKSYLFGRDNTFPIQIILKLEILKQGKSKK